MKLIPSLREKKRYIVFEVQSSQQFSLPDIKTEVEKALLLFLGQWGVSRASPQLVEEKVNIPQQRFILKVNHTHTDEVKSALILSTRIKNTPLRIRSWITSGSLKKASAYLDR